jgi:hypothetical protein
MFDSKKRRERALKMPPTALSIANGLNRRGRSPSMGSFNEANTNTMHTIQCDNNDIVIRFSRTALNSKTVTNLLDWLDLEDIRQTSQLTQAQANDLAQMVKQATWQELKHYVL